MKANEREFSVQIHTDLLKKFEYVANYNDRSMNGMMIFLIKKFVAKFEEKYGEIELEDEE